jgi:hypothetical protein
MGGHLPFTGETLVGPLNDIGTKEVYYGSNGREGTLFIENTYLTETQAVEYLTRRGCS